MLFAQVPVAVSRVSVVPLGGLGMNLLSSLTR